MHFSKLDLVLVAIAVLISAAAAPPAVFGQAVDIAESRYGQVTILSGATVNVGTPALTDLWTPQTGVRLSVESPFSVGRIGVAYQTMPFRGDGATYPDFRAHHLSATWGLEIPVHNWLRLYGGVSAGAWTVAFSGSGIDAHNNVESEIAGGAHGRVSVCVPQNPLCLFGAIGTTRILTEPRINHTSVSVGASFTVSAPDWLRRMLDGRPDQHTVANVVARAPVPNREAISSHAMRTSIGMGRTGRTVITAEELRRAGIGRLSEVLTLVDSWFTTTVDYFSWWATPSGTGGPSGASYSVLVGDQRVDLGPGKIWNLDRLGLNITQIDSVEVFDSPQLVAGEFTTGGLVRFFPRKVSTGPSVHAYGMAGNPNGDPGPHRYRPESSRNVDNAGHNVALNALVGTPDLGVMAGVIRRWGFSSDRRIAARVTSASTTVGARLDLNAPSLLVRIGEDSPHSIQLLASRFDNLRFLPLEARELPVRRDWIHAGMDGSLWNGESQRLKYRVGSDFNWIESTPNELGVQVQGRTGHQQFDLEYQATTQSGETGSIGIGMDIYGVDAVFPNRRDGTVRLRAYGRKQWCSSATICMGVEALGSHEDAGLGGHARGKLRWTSQQGVWASSSIVLSHSPETFVSDFLLSGGPATARSSLSADVEVGARVATGWNVTGTLFLRRHKTGRSLEHATGIIRTNLIPTIDSVLLDVDPNGWFSGLQLTYKWQSATAGASGAYTLQDVVDGSPGMTRSWAMLPQHRFRQSIWIGIGGEMTAQLAAEARSSSIIPSLMLEDETEQQVSTGKLLYLDLTLMKWFWKRRIWSSLRIRDLANSRKPVHPLGAAPGLTLFVQCDIAIPGSGNADRW